MTEETDLPLDVDPFDGEPEPGSDPTMGLTAGRRLTAMRTPAGATGPLVGLLILAATAIGLSLPAEVAGALVGLAVIAVSTVAPRWAERRGLLVEHPTGVAAAVGTVLVWFAPLVGLDLSVEQATALVGGVVAIVGLLTPRQPAVDPGVDPDVE